MTRDARRLARRAGAYAVLVIAAVIALFPIYWTLTTSLKPIVDALSIPPKFLFFDITLDNYARLISRPEFASSSWATILITSGVTILTVAVGALAAYPLARRWRTVGRRPLEASLVMIRVVPPVVLMVPLFNIAIALDLYDQIPFIIVIMSALNLPFAVWLMVSFIQQIPAELDECAQIDGASHLGVFLRVIVPLARPGLAATTIFVALMAWNEFLIPLVLADQRAKTLPLFISGFIQARTVDWGVMAAGAIVAIAPIAILTVAAQRSLVSGLGLGAVKG